MNNYNIVINNDHNGIINISPNQQIIPGKIYIIENTHKICTMYETDSYGNILIIYFDDITQNKIIPYKCEILNLL